MKSALKYSGLWEIVEPGATLIPKDLHADPAPSEVDIRAYEASLKCWKDLNNQASELIYSMCDDKPAKTIKDEDMAMNRWSKLRTDYTDSGFAIRATKFQELWSTSLEISKNSIETYVANL